QPEDQIQVAAGVRSGSAQLTGSGRHWGGPAQNVGVFDVKADVFATLASLGIDPNRAQIAREAPDWYHPGRSGVLRLGPKATLAHFGEINPKALAELDVDGPVAAFEIFLDALPPEKRKGRTRPPLAAVDLQPVRRDFAFVLDASVPAGDVVRAATGADKALITGVSVFDVFAGPSLGPGKKSVAIEVTLQPRERTLTDPEIDAVGKKIVAEVKRVTGGEIRG